MAPVLKTLPHAQDADHRRADYAKFNSGIVVSRKKREMIYADGDAADHIYYLESGAVALELYLRDGRRQLAEIVLPGDIFGYSASGMHCETAVALRECAIRVISRRDMQQATSACHEVAEMLGQQLIKSHNHILAMGRMTAEERVCSLLAWLSRAIGKPLGRSGGSGRIALTLPLTRGEMGDYLGLTLETVCRTMSCLQKRGIIAVGPHHGDIVLLKPDMVESLAG